VGTSPDQYDFALITDNDVAKFNLARLDANGVAGVRNVAVEGDLLITVTAAAQAFFGLASNQGGIALPSDNLAGVAIRDYAPPNSIQANSIQGVGFGSTTRFTVNHTVYGTSEVASDAANLLINGTAIVQADDTFLVPFADVANQQVGFFIDDAPNTNHNVFDNANVVFSVQSDNAQQSNVDRGAVTALVTVTRASSTTAPPSIIQTIDLRGDGGSLISWQLIAQGVTSTGPMGDIAINVTTGITNITAPSFFGNISSYGPITGTIQSTGVRVSPISGTTSTVSADIGRAYIKVVANGQLAVTSTSIQTDINGRTAFGPMGIASTGRVISRGNLISQLAAAGGIYGTIAVQGDIGAFSTLLSRTNPTRVGGIATDTASSGQIVSLGQIIGDVGMQGGLLAGAKIAARGSILGNLTINGRIAPGAVIISGGAIGNATLGTKISFGSNQGIIAADGAIFNPFQSPTVPPGYYSSNAGMVPPPNNFDAQAIDAVFSEPDGQPLTGFDLLADGDLEGLFDILTELALLHVQNRHLAV
jgi:hypothetical protein